MKSITASTLIALALAAGCGTAGYSGTVTVSASTPDLVAVAPGVQVIADYDESIFFADGYYWWNYDGGWYRSRSYTGGWIYVSSPPIVVARIHEPYRYRHYRPHGYVVRRRPVPAHRVERPVVRDHRSEASPRHKRDHRR